MSIRKIKWVVPICRDNKVDFTTIATLEHRSSQMCQRIHLKGNLIATSGRYTPPNMSEVAFDM